MILFNLRKIKFFLFIIFCYLSIFDTKHIFIFIFNLILRRNFSWMIYIKLIACQNKIDLEVNISIMLIFSKALLENNYYFFRFIDIPFTHLSFINP